MSAFNNEFTFIVIFVLGNVIPVYCSVFPCAVSLYFAFHNLHEFTLSVFKLFWECHKRKRFRNQVQKYIFCHIIFSLTKCCHSPICSFTRVWMDRCQHRVSCSACFLCQECFRASHFSYTNVIGIKSECIVEQYILVNILHLVFWRSCKGMDYTV